MKRSAIISACLIGNLAMVAEVRSIGNPVSGNDSYGAIVERNIFGLKDPPSAPPVAITITSPPPLNIKLTGITTILGNKRSLFLVQEPASPGKPPGREESYILTEGQSQGLLSVLEINEKSGTVRIKNDGKISVITFEPVKPAHAMSGIPPGQARGAMRPGTPAYAPPQLANQGPGSIPAPARTQPGPYEQMTPEEQIILMEAQREANKNNPSAPPLPPTPLTPSLPGAGDANT